MRDDVRENIKNNRANRMKHYMRENIYVYSTQCKEKVYKQDEKGMANANPNALGLTLGLALEMRACALGPREFLDTNEKPQRKWVVF